MNDLAGALRMHCQAPLGSPGTGTTWWGAGRRRGTDSMLQTLHLSRRSTPSPSPWGVLVIEDNEADADLIQAMLDQYSPGRYRFSRAQTLADGLNAASRADCALLDLSLPDASGIEGVQALEQVQPDLAVIVLTGADDEKLGEAALRAGAQDYLVKGQAPPAIIDSALRYALERQQQRTRLTAGHAQLARQVDERRRVEDDLRLSHRQVAGLIEHSSDIIAVVDSDGMLRSANPAVSRILGWSVGELTGRPVVALVHPDDLARVHESLGETLSTGGPPLEVRLATADGGWRDVEAVANNRQDDPSVLGIIVSVRDLRERREGERSRAEATDRFRQAFHGSLVGTALLSEADGSFVEVNSALCEMLGYREPELLATFLPLVVPADERADMSSILDEVRSGATDQFKAERRLVNADEIAQWVQLSITRLDQPGDRVGLLICQVEDIDERRTAEVRLVHKTLHDPLTGLPNRLLLRDHLALALSRRKRPPDSVGLFFLDLDRFKLINDAFGHDVGDELLVVVAERISRAVRPEDTVSRLGGDEFVVLADDLAGTEEASRIAERIRVAVSKPAHVRGREVVPTVSIGIALADQRHQSPDQLLADADSAMYRAKDWGKDRFATFNDALRQDANQRVRVEGMIREALRRDRVTALYQPIIDLSGGGAVGAEALLRLRSEDGDLIEPSGFLEVAEDTGLVVQLGARVLDAACREAVGWNRPGAPLRQVNVNLSAHQLNVPDLADTLGALLEEIGLAPAALSLELTESALMSAGPSAIRTLHALKSVGVRLGIDDFGTGYSSLTYLRSLPADFVKIDRSFVAGLDHNEDDSAIVAAVVHLARSLGLTTVAEGVESVQQLERLQTLGCDFAQGFLFDRPQPAEKVRYVLSALVGDSAGGRTVNGRRRRGEP